MIHYTGRTDGVLHGSKFDILVLFRGTTSLHHCRLITKAPNPSDNNHREILETRFRQISFPNKSGDTALICTVRFRQRQARGLLTLTTHLKKNPN